MSNVIVDGFALYGTGGIGNHGAVGSNMLAGIYADLGSRNAGQNFVGTPQPEILKGLPWDATETSYWLRADSAATSGIYVGPRRVLPSAQTTIIVSMHIALASLPSGDDIAPALQLRNAANEARGTLYIQNTGAVAWTPGDGPQVQSAGPVIVAEKVHHIELKLNRSTKALELRVDGAAAINTTLTDSTTDNIAQYCVAGCQRLGTGVVHSLIYVSDVIVRTASGTYNDDFMGDRKVATLLPNGDDAGNDGWTPRPLRRFGNGVLNLTANANAGVLGPNSIATDLGSGDFTIEGQFRLKSLPTGSNKAVLFGKWDEGANQRSYQLYIGGPSLDEGLLVFRTSTDGQNGTVVQKLLWPWQPEIGRWYHIAVARDSGDLRLFIDGVQAGITVADMDAYHPSSARPAIGVQTTGAAAVADTHWMGWQDEFRLTVGACRYTSNFAPPTTGFPRDGGDADWAFVAWLSSWNDATLADDGPNGITLTGVNNAAAVTPNDGFAGYQVLNKLTPNEDTFLEAALVSATGVFTLSALPTAAETVTLGTSDGSTPAVYKFVASLTDPFDVLIGSDAAESVFNLVSAINKDAGEGTLYGTGTVANYDAEATLMPNGQQFLATAFVPGSSGNSIASTTTCADGDWNGETTLVGGADIPDPSAFYFQRLPAGATVVDSVTFSTRQYKTDSGVAKTQVSLLAIGGADDAGTEYTLGTAPNVHFDTFEEDPDTSSGLTPQSVRTMRVLIDRTA